MVSNGSRRYCFSDGPLYITESILDIQYTISPFSFFQTNSYQLDQFVDHIIQQAHIDSDSQVWDLYCGAGTITFPAAKKLQMLLASNCLNHPY